MRYNLYDGAVNDTTNAVEKVLKNRGIDDYKKYLNLDDSVVTPYSKLQNIDEAVNLFMKHFKEFNKISILVDSDPDGYCSAAMMYLYIKRMNEVYPVEYILHTKPKTHGLTSDVLIPYDTKLLIVPDASTNDTEQCKLLSEDGIDILILDHHENETNNPYATIVNNQMSKYYPNKDLCGAGVVYRFLQALDEETWNEFADDYLDLCALANISDVMDMRSYETRYFVNCGLANIKNKCIDALIKSQDYSMNGKVTVHNIQWYITTILNGCIRVGTQEEKELLFQAFIEQDKFFEYKKRATKDKPAEVIQENIYDRAARLCKNAKARQDKKKDKCVSEVLEIAESNLSDNDKVVMVDVTNIVDKGLTGVVAIKIADILHKPCILLSSFEDDNGDIVYGGSARNINHSPIKSFKDIVNSTNIFSGVGHANAFGCVGLQVDKMEDARNSLNNILKDVDYDSTYYVDFILDADDMSVGLIMDLSSLDDIIGQGIDEPLVGIENISLIRSDFEIFGKNEDTISFSLNGIKYIQFKCKDGNSLYDWLQNAWDDEDYIEFNIVGKPTINVYDGMRTPQIIIEDVNVITTKTKNNDDEEDGWW